MTVSLEAGDCCARGGKTIPVPLRVHLFLISLTPKQLTLIYNPLCYLTDQINVTEVYLTSCCTLCSFNCFYVVHYKIDKNHNLRRAEEQILLVPLQHSDAELAASPQDKGDLDLYPPVGWAVLCEACMSSVRLHGFSSGFSCRPKKCMLYIVCSLALR